MNTSNTWRRSFKVTQNSTLPLSKEGILHSQVLINIRSSIAQGLQQHQILIILSSSAKRQIHISSSGIFSILAILISSSEVLRCNNIIHTIQQQYQHDATTASSRYNNSINMMQQQHQLDHINWITSTGSSLGNIN